jgi:hypothetical protein
MDEFATTYAGQGVDQHPNANPDVFLHSEHELVLDVAQRDEATPVVLVGASSDLTGHSDAGRTTDVQKPLDFWTRVGKKSGSSEGTVLYEGVVNPIVTPSEAASKALTSKAPIEGYQLLGQYFVHAGRITEEQLKSALAKQAKSFARIGEILVRSGLVSPAEVEACLEHQAKYRQLSEILKMMV